MDSGAFQRILLVKVEKAIQLLGQLNFIQLAGNQTRRVSRVAHNRAANLHPGNGSFQNYLIIIDKSSLQSRRQLRRVAQTANPKGTAGPHRLHKKRPTNALCQARRFCRSGFSVNPRKLRHRNAGRSRQLMRPHLVHTQSGSQSSATHQRQTGQLQQPLHGAVLAILAVQNRQSSVHRQQPGGAFGVSRQQQQAGLAAFRPDSRRRAQLRLLPTVRLNLTNIAVEMIPPALLRNTQHYQIVFGRIKLPGHCASRL